MSQLKSISLENFKVFKKETKIDISPMTILVGPNNSGKSSIFKSLLLMADNVKNNSIYKLDFTSSKHNLGTFKDSKNYTSEKNNISFKFEFNYFPTKRRNISTPRKNHYFLFDGRKIKQRDITLIFETEYSQDGNSGKLVLLNVFLKSNENEEENLLFSFSDSNKSYYDVAINLYWILFILQNFQVLKDSIDGNEKDLLNKFLKDLEKYDNGKEINEFKINKIQESKEDYISFILREFFMDDFLNKKVYSEYYNMPTQSQEEKYKRFSNAFKNVQNFIKKILDEFENCIGYINYLEAVRGRTRRIYTNDSQTSPFDNLILDFLSSDNSKESIDFLNYWIKEFGIADKVEIKDINGIASTVTFTKNKKEITIADLGQAVTQFLPILLSISLEKPNKNETLNSSLKKLILIEEPETNLHPNLQAKLAEIQSRHQSKNSVI